MEDLILTLMGLAMIYAMIHSTVIIIKKIKGITSYERVILWVGFASVVSILLELIYSV